MKKRQTSRSTATMDETRRDLMKRFALTTIGIGSVAVTAFSSPTIKADSHLIQLDEASAQAKALGYKHNIAEVDAEKYPQSQGENKICANCQLYSAVTDDGWGACPIFAGRLVNGNGWCSAWVQAVKS